MEIEFLSNDPQDKLIEAFVSGEAKTAAKASTALNSLIVKLSKKETTLVSIITDLQPHLTSTNQLNRTKGCLLIFELLDRCQNLELTAEQFLSLYEYFISKMTDIATTQEAVKCIYNLLQRNSKGQKIHKDEKQLFDLFYSTLKSKSFHTPAYAQEIRYVVYQILRYFTQNNEQYCIDLKENFVSIVLIAIEEEQDPRNLMISFKLIYFLLDKFPQKTIFIFQKDIFEILSMYYPISFTPPENDVFKITPQDLEAELNMCLCHPIFLDQTVELVFDKMTASQDSAKIACFNTLEQLAQKSTTKHFISKYGADLWEKIKMIYYAANAEVEQRCLSFLEMLFKQSSNQSVDKGFHSGTLDEISGKILNGSFTEIQQGSTTQKASKSAKLLALLSSVSEELSNTILSRYFTIFLDKYEIQKPADCQSWLEFLFRFYDSWEKHHQGKTDPNKGLFGIKLDLFKAVYQRIKDIIESSLSSEPIRIIALKIYAHATNLLFRCTEQKSGFDDLCRLLQGTEQSSLLKECTADALIISAEGFDLPVVEETIARILKIFDEVFIQNAQTQQGTLEYFFSTHFSGMFYILKTFSNRKGSRKQVLDLLLRFLTQQLQELKISSEHLIIAVETLQKVIVNINEKEKKEKTAGDLSAIHTEIFKILVTNLNLENGLIQLKKTDKSKYLVLKSNLKNIISQISSSGDLAEQAFSYFVEVLRQGLYATSQLKLLTWSLEAIKETGYQTKSKDAFLALVALLQERSFVGKEEETKTVGRILRAFTNKTKDSDTLMKVLVYLSKAHQETNDINKLSLYCYAIKGAIAKGDKTGYQCLVQFLNTSLPFVSEGKEKAKIIACYKILIKDISKEFSEFTISTTSKQRLFSMVFPYTYTLYQKGKDEKNVAVKDFFTVVIMYLITQIPFKILKSNFQQILPIILQNVSKLNEEFESQLDNIEYSIDFISKMLQESEDVSERVEELASNLLIIARLLRENFSRTPEDFYIRNVVNIAKSLIRIAKLPFTNVNTLREEILQTMAQEKDNRRRLIRKYAAACINEWSMS